MSAPNGEMMQFFHWYNAPDGSLWNELSAGLASAQKNFQVEWL